MISWDVCVSAGCIGTQNSEFFAQYERIIQEGFYSFENIVAFQQ